MIQQLFDSPQDMNPNSLIGASTNYEYSLLYLSHGASAHKPFTYAKYLEARSFLSSLYQSQLQVTSFLESTIGVHLESISCTHFHLIS